MPSCPLVVIEDCGGQRRGMSLCPGPPLHPLLVTKHLGEDDEQVVIVVPLPLSLRSLPSSVLPHHPHLLPFPFGSDVVVVVLDLGGVIVVGGHDMAAVSGVV